jgi:transposase
MELSLPVDTDGSNDREWQISVGREISVDARAPSRSDLVADHFDLIVRFRVNEVARALEVAIDTQLVDEQGHVLDRRRIGSRVRPGCVLPRRLEELAIDEPMPDGQLRGGVSRHTPDDSIRLEERNSFAGLLQ